MLNLQNVNIELLIKLFENSIADVISTISGISVLKRDNNDLNSNLNEGFVGILPFSGGINGFFMMKTDEQSLKTLTSYITGCDMSLAKEDDMMDCIGELANMVCGTVRAKAALNGISFKLSIPFSALGVNGLKFSFKKNTKTFTLRFSSCGIHINTRVVLA